MRDHLARPTIGHSFNPRDNALNLLRVMLAIMVIFSHSLILGGFRGEALWGHGTLGDLAVDAFFAVSGFLITPSAVRNHVVRYLWQRVLRIFPGYWVCLLATGVIAGPIAWTAQGRPLARYWSDPLGVLHYLRADLPLNMKTYAIAGTPARVPYPGVWDGSLWTLRWEFICYLMVAVLAVTAVLARRRIVLVLWAVSWLAALGAAADGIPTYNDRFVYDLIRFVPIFFAGSVLWLYRDKIPDSRLLFAVALSLVAVGTFLRNPEALSGPPLAYVCVWAAIHLPGKKVGSKHDISYGTYIYAFVVGQLLAVWHLYRWGYFPFTILTLAITLALAAISCVVVEQPALRLKRWSPRLLYQYAPRHGPSGHIEVPADPVRVTATTDGGYGRAADSSRHLADLQAQK